jgi:hypothetical protein
MSEQLTLPGVGRTLDLEPLLRGELIAQLAAVLMRVEPVPAWWLCARCGLLVENETWGVDKPEHRCRVCLRRAAERRSLSAESQAP